MLLRFWHAKSDSKRWASAKLGSFSIIATHQQGKATSDLYRYLVETKGVPQRGPLLQYLHCLLDVLVRTKNSVEDCIACPTDQAACLSSLRPHGHFRMANVFTGWCAMLQHCMFDISAHIVRLEFGGHDHYTFLESVEGGRSDIHHKDVRPEVNEDLNSDGGSNSAVVETSSSEDEQSDSTVHSRSNSEVRDSCDDVDESDSGDICDNDSGPSRGDDNETREGKEDRIPASDSECA